MRKLKDATGTTSSVVEARLPGLGTRVALLDLEASALGSLDALRTARWLLSPVHPGPGSSRVRTIALP